MRTKDSFFSSNTEHKGVKACIQAFLFRFHNSVLFGFFFLTLFFLFLTRRYLLPLPGMLSFLRHITRNHFIWQALETFSLLVFHAWFCTYSVRCVRSTSNENGLKKRQKWSTRARTRWHLLKFCLFFISSHTYIVTLNSVLFLSIFKGAKMQKFVVFFSSFVQATMMSLDVCASFSFVYVYLLACHKFRNEIQYFFRCTFFSFGKWLNVEHTVCATVDIVPKMDFWFPPVSKSHLCESVN